ncbi:MAG: transketolase C-terminal domain-containing protein [Pseudomonadota bacterium]|nr:transketolase C-terminal domain-containing protein [Pseudomonadota bacterium]
MKQNMFYRDALALAQEKEMAADPTVFVFGLDVPDHKQIFGSTKNLLEKFGSERCFGTPLSEDAMTGVALGAAITGMRPIHVHIRADFMLLGMNQIANMISSIRYMSGGKLKVPLVIRAVIGRGWGQSAQHSKSMHSSFAHIPGLKVVMPTTPQDAYSLLRASVRDDNPVIFLEHRWLYDISGEVDDSKSDQLGKAIVRREGKDVTIIATSWMTVEALQAAEILQRKNINVEVVDVRSIAPVDMTALENSVNKTKNCLVADYDWIFCGFSAEVAAELSHRCFESLERPIERIGFEHVPCPTTRPLENIYYPSALSLVRRIEKMLGLAKTDVSQDKFYTYEERFRGPF